MEALKSLLQLHVTSKETDFSRVPLVLAAAVLYGICLRLVYRHYYVKNEPVDGSVGRSFPLMAAAVAAIFWVIQFSLPLSLGLLGALSFVRFRTPIKRAEDISFILILISGALACAVQHFLTAALVLVLVTVYSFVRSGWSKAFTDSSHSAVLSIQSRSALNVETVADRLKEFAPGAQCVNYGMSDGVASAIFNLPRLDNRHQSRLVSNLQEMDAGARIEVFIPDSRLGGFA